MPRWMIALSVIAAGTCQAAELDLTKIERNIGQQPQYVAQEPLFGLLVLGPKGQTRIWMAVDRSEPEGKHYDVAYVDLNANGKLTDEGERFEVKPNPAGESQFIFPDLADAATGQTHTQFKLTISEPRRRVHLVTLMWNGKSKMSGGYPENPDGGYLQLANSPQEAPILWANGDGPFRFQFWYPEKLVIGRPTDVKVFIGLPGIGRNSFWAFSQHVLPANCNVRATLIYEDTSGKRQELLQELKERC